MIMIAFGIASLFFSILGVFIPLVGIIISGLSGFLAWLSAGRGTALGAAAVIINLINLFLLSPGYMLLVHIEAQHRSADQTKSVTIWMIVLFIQIAAIAVFIGNFLVTKYDFFSLITARKGKSEKKNSDSVPSSFGNKIKPFSDSEDLESNTEFQKNISRVSNTIIHKLHRGKHPSQKFWESEFENESRNLQDVEIDRDKPHRNHLLQNKKSLQLISGITVLIIFALTIVSLRPDLFQFLTYSNIYNSIARILPENHPNQIRIVAPQPTNHISKEEKRSSPYYPTSSLEDDTDLQAQNRESKTQIPENNLTQNSYRKELTEGQDYQRPNYGNGKFWYIIQLQDGETIVTQSAVETNGVIVAVNSDGTQKMFKRNEVRDVKKFMIK